MCSPVRYISIKFVTKLYLSPRTKRDEQREQHKAALLECGVLKNIILEQSKKDQWSEALREQFSKLYLCSFIAFYRNVERGTNTHILCFQSLKDGKQKFSGCKTPQNLNRFLNFSCISSPSERLATSLANGDKTKIQTFEIW